MRALRSDLVSSGPGRCARWAVPYGPTADRPISLPGVANIGFPGCSADAI